MKTPKINIEIASTCNKCSFLEWKHYTGRPGWSGDKWHCALWQQDLTDRSGFQVLAFGSKEIVQPCDECLRLVRHFEEVPEIDPTE